MEIKKVTYTIPETAIILGIGRTLAYRLANTGVLPVLYLGNRMVVSGARLEEFINKIA